MKQIIKRVSYSRGAAACVIFVVTLVGYLALRIFAATPSAVKSVAVTELGGIENPQAPYLIRDGGASGLVDGKVLWTFGDTIFTRPSASGVGGISNSAGYASISQPTVVTEPLDSKGTPTQLIPFNTEELAYNKLKSKGDDRYAIWPSSVVSQPDGSALILYLRLMIQPGNLNYHLLGTGVAKLAAGQTTAIRLIDNLFATPGPYFTQSALVVDSTLYLYGCNTTIYTSDCKVARVPVAQMQTRSAYTFWRGNAWSSDVNMAVSQNFGGSVGYNSFLKTYVSVGNLAYGKVIQLRTAPSPQGPWSEPTSIYTAPSYIYAVEQHPEISPDNGRTIFISYYRPDEKPVAGHPLKLIKVVLNPGAVVTPPSTPPGSPSPSPGSPNSVMQQGNNTAVSQGVSIGVSGNNSSNQSRSAQAQANLPLKKNLWDIILSIILTPWNWLIHLF